MKIKLIYRKKRPEFNSIENVFNALLPYLPVEKIELPYFSEGYKPRKENIGFIKKLDGKLFHITGNDHYLILGLKKKKTILTIHDIEVLKRSSGLKRFILKKLWFDLPIKYAKSITTISEFSKQEILGLNNYKTPIEVIHNPLTLPIEFSPKNFNKECPNILHIGTKHNKNLDNLIEALTSIKCTLTIVGSPTEQQQSKLESLGIPYRVLTNISNEEMVQTYINCDMLSFVSTYEGFGLPIIESQACGRVVLSSNTASMPEISGKGAFLVDPHNVTAIANGLTELIQNDSIRENLIKNGLENVKRFQVNEIANQYKKLYQTVLDEK